MRKNCPSRLGYSFLASYGDWSGWKPTIMMLLNTPISHLPMLHPCCRSGSANYFDTKPTNNSILTPSSINYFNPSSFTRSALKCLHHNVLRVPRVKKMPNPLRPMHFRSNQNNTDISSPTVDLLQVAETRPN